MYDQMRKYDTVVIGGGLSGIGVSITAARLGNEVALVHERSVLGGNSSSEVRIGPGGASAMGRNRAARESGVLEELRIENAYRNPSLSWPIWDRLLEEWVKKEDKLDLYLNTQATEVVMDEGSSSINSVNAVQSGTEKEFRFLADNFVDATGDGEVAARAGAEFMYGREGRDEYDEDLAPETPDTKVLGGTVQFSVKRTDEPVPFTPPPSAQKFESCSELPEEHKRLLDDEIGYWWIEYGGSLNTITDNEKIYDRLVSKLFGIWDHVKNHCELQDEAKNYVLDTINPIVGKRESRRIMGDHVLNQNELFEDNPFPDPVAYGGWPIDVHPSEGLESNESPATQVFLPKPYKIPYRSLYSRDIDNLFLAGRDISVTHVAHATTREMGTCFVIGQAVGTAAYMCTRNQKDPEDLFPDDIEELQQTLLKQDCYIPGVKNKDNEDLARKATITGSSEKPLSAEATDKFVPLDETRGQLFPLTEENISSASIFLKSELGEAIDLTASLCVADDITEISKGETIKQAEARVEPGREQRVKFDFDEAVDPSKPHWVQLPKAEGLFWGQSNSELIGTRRLGLEGGELSPEIGHYAEELAEWRIDKGTYNFDIEPQQGPYSGENVASGVARPVQHEPNIWISDPEEVFPQHLELTFDTARKFNSVYLTFDTNLDHHMKPELEEGLEVPVEETISDYELYYLNDEEEWKLLKKISGNYHRRRIHRFEPIESTALRIKVLDTNGSSSARIFEVRVYDER